MGLKYIPIYNNYLGEYMKNFNQKKILTIGLFMIFLFSCIIPIAESQNMQIDQNINIRTQTLENETKYIEYKHTFSEPEIVPYRNYIVVRVKETNHNRIILFDYNPGKPVIPVNISVFNLEFGSKILDIEFEYSTPEIIDLPDKLIYGRASIDGFDYLPFKTMDLGVYENSDPYPIDWVSYHTGGGLSFGERTSFLVVRVYPVRYYPVNDQLEFIRSITVNISYQEPEEPIIQEEEKQDLLILAPSNFLKDLQPLVYFKENHGVKTEIHSLEDVYNLMGSTGRDRQEKIKYFIKESIEKWDIKYVLLVGGIKGQSSFWNLPIRYSRVVPMEEQEYPEQMFVSDIYYADIFDSEGGFSSWDSNMDDEFAVWNETFKEEMDNYPDVYLGRLACRDVFEVKTMVNKILNYEMVRVANEDWFNNLLLVAGDSYINNIQWPEDVIVNEGELAGEEAVKKMPGFNPIRVYASEMDINRKTVNNAMKKGCSFAYICGHGSAASWNTHFEPADENNWCTGYDVFDMIFLKNKEKLPIAVIGGCHNGEFNKSISMRVKNGLAKKGLQYFSPTKGRFWFDGWIPNCWAWFLTSKRNGGTIATIANTGLGTHGDGDQDNNSVVDYLEVLDGWLELRFLELYGIEDRDILGENHGQTLTEYLHRFLGDDAKMDVKMVHQWELFGDPSMKIGGYEF